MNELKIFESEQFGRVRMVVKNDEPWFVGKDVAAALGYYDINKAVAMHVDDEDKLKDKSSPSFGQRGCWIINESGLYSLILSSKLPEAKAFKRWITSEVIPSIRKNDGYIAKQEELSDVELMAKALRVAERITEERERRIKELEPKGDYYDALVDRGLNINFRAAAKELGIGERELIRTLEIKKYIYRDAHNKIMPYADKVKDGLFVVKEFVNPYNNEVGLQTLITPAGRMKIKSRMAF